MCECVYVGALKRDGICACMLFVYVWLLLNVSEICFVVPDSLRKLGDSNSLYRKIRLCFYLCLFKFSRQAGSLISIQILTISNKILYTTWIKPDCINVNIVLHILFSLTKKTSANIKLDRQH